MPSPRTFLYLLGFVQTPFDILRHHRVGNLRLRLPELLTSYNGTVDATAFGNQCIQEQGFPPLDAPQELLQDVATYVSETESGGDFGVSQSEDCAYRLLGLVYVF